MDILNKRLKTGCMEQKALESSNLSEVANKLKTVTGNPLAFLTWLDYLCNYTELDPEKLAGNLRGYVKTHYSTIDINILEKLAKRFIYPKKRKFIGLQTRSEIMPVLDNSDALFNKLIDRGVLIPEDLYEDKTDANSKYSLSQEFAFFNLDESIL